MFATFRYCSLFHSGENYAHQQVNWEVLATKSDGNGFQHCSFVNAISTPKGCTHVDQLVEAVTAKRQEPVVALHQLPHQKSCVQLSDQGADDNESVEFRSVCNMSKHDRLLNPSFCRMAKLPVW